MALPPSIKKTTTKSGHTRYHVRFRWRTPSSDGGPSDQNELDKTFNYLGDAQRWLLEQQQKHMQGRRKPETTLVWLFQHYYETFKENHLRPSSRYAWQQVKKNFILKYFGKDLTVSDITRDRYQRAIDAYAATGVSHTTIKMAHQRMREVFAYAVEEGYTTTNATTRVKLGGKAPRNVEYLSVDEIKTILKYISEHTFRKRNGLSVETGTPYLIEGLLLTGCRESELAGLTWDRVDVDTGTFKIDRQWRTCSSQTGGHGFGPLKTPSSYRTVTVPKSFISTLLSIKDPDDVFVFNSRSACFPPSETSISRFLSRILDACDIHKAGFHVHSLRHSHVALLLDADVDIYTISRRLGHKNFSTTLNTYAYLIDEYKQRADEKTLSALNKLL